VASAKLTWCERRATREFQRFFHVEEAWGCVILSSHIATSTWKMAQKRRNLQDEAI
jgi:hypothetical protein